MATKVYLLRHGPYQKPDGFDNWPLNRQHGWAEQLKPDYEHFVGCPFHGPNKYNIDLARTFKTQAAAKATNEFKHWSYEVVEGEVTITLKEKT